MLSASHIFTYPSYLQSAKLLIAGTPVKQRYLLNIDNLFEKENFQTATEKQKEFFSERRRIFVKNKMNWTRTIPVGKQKCIFILFNFLL